MPHLRRNLLVPQFARVYVSTLTNAKRDVLSSSERDERNLGNDDHANGVGNRRTTGVRSGHQHDGVTTLGESTALELSDRHLTERVDVVRWRDKDLLDAPRSAHLSRRTLAGRDGHDGHGGTKTRDGPSSHAGACAGNDGDGVLVHRGSPRRTCNGGGDSCRLRTGCGQALDAQARTPLGVREPLLGSADDTIHRDYD